MKLCALQLLAALAVMAEDLSIYFGCDIQLKDCWIRNSLRAEHAFPGKQAGILCHFEKKQQQALDYLLGTVPQHIRTVVSTLAVGDPYAGRRQWTPMVGLSFRAYIPNRAVDKNFEDRVKDSSMCCQLQSIQDGDIQSVHC